MNKVEDLPFVHRTQSGSYDFWKPEILNNGYTAENALGREYAAALHRHIAENISPTVFGAVIRAITSRGTYGGVEVGFCHYFALHLIDLPVDAEMMKRHAAQEM